MKPSEPVQACNGFALPVPFTFIPWPCLEYIREDRLRLLTRPNKTDTVNGDYMTITE